MRIKRQKVLDALKIKAYNLGFSEDELGKVADKIVDNNEVADDADDSTVNELINTSIDSVMDYLSLAQSASQRTISKFKNKQKEGGEKGKVVEKPVEPNAKTTTEPTSNDSGNDAKQILETLLKKFDDFETKTNERFERINSENIAQTRYDKLKDVVKDAGDFGERELRNFKRMKFADEDDFNAYLKDIQDNAREYNTNSSQKKLQATPPKSNQSKEDVKVASDEELKAIAERI